MRAKLALIVGVLTLVGCGGSPPPTSHPTVPPVPKGLGTRHCEPAPGAGVAGICVPRGPTAQRPSATKPERLGAAHVFPDLSEWNGTCTAYSEAIIRVYEAGLDREDHKAGCLAHNLAAKGVWWAVYSFLRPGNCNYQADRTVALTRSLGVAVVGPVIADAEVWLPSGFVTCWVHRVEHDGYRAATYTSPGTWPGGAFASRVWVAAYPYRPACFSNACPYVAHQFSSEADCRGIRGDCSLNEGILAIRQKAPVNRQALIARREVLRYVLLHYGCRKRIAEHRQLGPRCSRWRSEGNLIARELAASA